MKIPTFVRDQGRVVLPTALLLMLMLVAGSGAIARAVEPAGEESPRPADAPLGWVHWRLALEAMQAGDCPTAMHQASYLLKHPEFSTPPYTQQALILHGQCYEQLGKPAEAMRAYLHALKGFGKNEVAFLKLGELYLHEQNPSAAVKALHGALSMNKENPRIYTSLASAYLALGDQEKAAKSIASAERLGADVRPLRERLAHNTTATGE